jgi:hypothetical protein
VKQKGVIRELVTDFPQFCADWDFQERRSKAVSIRNGCSNLCCAMMDIFLNAAEWWSPGLDRLGNWNFKYMSIWTGNVSRSAKYFP